MGGSEAAALRKGRAVEWRDGCYGEGWGKGWRKREGGRGFREGR